MKTIIYLCRHSEPIDMYDNKNETMQLRNEKISLSVLGEEKARKLSLLPELNNIDNVIASNYVRAIKVFLINKLKIGITNLKLVNLLMKYVKECILHYRLFWKSIRVKRYL